MISQHSLQALFIAIQEQRIANYNARTKYKEQYRSYKIHWLHMLINYATAYNPKISYDVCKVMSIYYIDQ